MKIYQAGAISILYDNGFLRRIAYGETEVLRMIYFALRDHNWNTQPHRIENEEITADADSFNIKYDCIHAHEGSDIMGWSVHIDGRPDGTIIFEINGKTLHELKKNRAGFCVLHPLNTTDTPCTLTHPDKRETTHLFPLQVAPENPLKDIQSMAWKSAGLMFELTFEGDVFETEDQRNWCDASFKTFCTPLDKPFPVVLKKGEKVFQRITFRSKSALQTGKKTSSFISLEDTGVKSIVPAFGVSSSTEVKSLPPECITLLRALRLSHYRIDLYPGNANWVTAFSEEYERAFEVAVPLEVVLHLTDNFKEETEAFTMLCLQNKVKVKKVLLLKNNGLVTSQDLIDQAAALKQALPKTIVGAGTNYNFNEINKNHFHHEGLDFISFSIDPQEHATDDLTILENTEAMGHLVQSAKKIYGASMPIHISPITLRKRFNPYATNPADLFLEESKKADPRQKDVFTAVWIFASICSLAQGGAQAITFFQTIGNQGILSRDGGPYPVYHTLKSFAPFQGKQVNIIKSSEPLNVQAILLDSKILAMVNLTGDEMEVRMNKLVYKLSPREIRFEPLSRA